MSCDHERARCSEKNACYIQMHVITLSIQVGLDIVKFILSRFVQVQVISRLEIYYEWTPNLHKSAFALANRKFICISSFKLSF